jgi:hypothetical protein
MKFIDFNQHPINQGTSTLFARFDSLMTFEGWLFSSPTNVDCALNVSATTSKAMIALRFQLNFRYLRLKGSGVVEPHFCVPVKIVPILL